MAEVTGTTAREMAAAPRNAAPGKAVKIPFDLVRYSYPNKVEKVYLGEDKVSQSQQVGVAVLKIAGSDLHFTCKINRHSTTDGSQKPVLKLALPSTGKFFSRPVFTVEGNPALTSALESWKSETVKGFMAWRQGNKQNGVAIAQTVSGIEDDSE